MSSDKTKYDFMIPFFGLENDYRVRLYLHVLENAYNKNKTILSDPTYIFGLNAGIIDEELTVEFTDDNYRLSVISLGDKDISPEWREFASSLNERFKNSTSNDLKILEIIRDISTKPNPQFFIEVIKLHLDEITINTGSVDRDVKDSNTLWKYVYKYKFKDLNSSRLLDSLKVGTPLDFVMYNTSFDNKPLNFHYNLVKFLVYSLDKQAKNIINSPSSFWDDDSISFERDFVRDPNNPNNIGKIDNNGNFINYSQNSDKHHSLKNKSLNDMCKNTFGVKVTDGSQNCVDYIQKCINSGNDVDIENCKEFMQNQTFWEDIKSIVNEMLPFVMIDTLNKFNFQVINHPENNMIKMYESVNNWLINLRTKIDNKNFTENEYNNIVKNTKLKTYLHMIVKKINNNPSILNQHLVKTKNLNSWASMIGIQSRNIKKPIKNTDFDAFYRELFTYKADLLDLTKISKNRINFSNGFIYINGIKIPLRGPMFGGDMVGGDMVGGVTIISPTIDGDIKPRRQGELIENITNNVISKIESMGKQLTPSDKQELLNSVQKYKDLENKLIKAIVYADKYIDMVRLVGDDDSLIDLNHIKEFVEARDKIVFKSINQQGNIINTLEYILNDTINSLNNQNSVKSFRPNV